MNMLDNSLKPLLKLKFPPPQRVDHATVQRDLAQDAPKGGAKCATEPSAEVRSINAEIPQISILDRAKQEVSSDTDRSTPPKATKEKFRLNYTHAGGRPWGTPPKHRTPSQLRYRAKKLAARKEGWIDIVCGMFVETVGADREPLVAFAKEQREIVRDAFDRRVLKDQAVAKLAAAWAEAQEQPKQKGNR